MNKFLVVLVVIFMFLLVASIYITKPTSPVKLVESQINTPIPTLVQEKLTPTVASTPSPTVIKKTRVLIENVPFSSQAPFAQWKDPRFQDGCEEAAALLAVYWAKGLSLDKTKAKEEILAMSAYQSEKYQEFRDTSVFDSADRLIKGYFNYDKFEIRENINIEDIKSELLKGNLLIVPTNGQALNNPHFTAPGPERHNIVVRGFDDTAKIFITNDPGILEGELYQYPQQVFYDAIRDYPTGYHQPITKTKKVMIIVRKA